MYSSDTASGIRRLRRGRGFAYRDEASGRWVRDGPVLERIRRLAIPPAYTAVWISPLDNGHLQATGRDARGRKQYRYHAEWQRTRDANKFDRLQAFGKALPALRARVARDLAGPLGQTPTRTLVLATLVRLLDKTFLRVGNDAYARQNGSFGLTTLRRDHADIDHGRLRLHFRGKSGVMHDVTIDDPRAARVVRRCQQLPGQMLFAWAGDDGQRVSIGSADVNDYLAEATGERFTAKHFRTWHGSVQALALCRLARRGEGSTPATAMTVLRSVAARLGNTVAVCRKAYVHPRVMRLVATVETPDERLEPEDALAWKRVCPAIARRRRGLSADECRFMRLLGLPATVKGTRRARR